jgi:DNA-directed RNA polymerase specialized sigma24 family protein
MSWRERRDRERKAAREHALFVQRAKVLGALAPLREVAGSAAIEDAVAEGLLQLLGHPAAQGDPGQAVGLWITFATRRLVDERGSAHERLRDGVGVDEHPQALAVTVADGLELGEEEERQWARIRELFDELEGEYQRWGVLWQHKVISGSLKVGAQPRGIGGELGWSASKTKSVSKRARLRLAAFIELRASGAVCEATQALLADLHAAQPGGPGPVGDAQRYEALLAHVEGCEDCSVAWRTRQAQPRPHLAFVLPTVLLGWLQRRLAAAGAALAGSGLATKATVCAGVLCAGGALVDAAPSILPIHAHHRSPHAARPSSPPPRPRPLPPQLPLAPQPQPPAPAAPRPRPRVHHATVPPVAAPAGASSAGASSAGFTPGDLPPRGSSTRAAP